eukprot:551163-Pelagomonas_calceolata.AAC.1
MPEQAAPTKVAVGLEVGGVCYCLGDTLDWPKLKVLHLKEKHKGASSWGAIKELGRGSKHGHTHRSE